MPSLNPKAMTVSAKSFIFTLAHQYRVVAAIMVAAAVASPAQAISLTDVFNSPATSQAAKKPLPVNQAFAVVTEQTGDTLKVTINVTDGYYTYRDKLKLQLPEGVTATPFMFNQTPSYVDDPDFGRVAVFDKDVTAVATLSSPTAITNQPAVLKWQGCAKAGLCYPPEKVNFIIHALAGKGDKAEAGKAGQAVKSAMASAITPTAAVSTPQATANKPAVAQSLPTAQPTIQPSISTTAQANQDIFGLTTHTPLALLLLFLAGLGLAFTPCVLPMLPIVANIVARQHKPSAKKGLLLTSSYGLGVATSYGLIGALVAVFGQSLGLMAMLQDPVILLSFAGLFILLGLYMLDKLPIRLPLQVSQRLQRLGQVGENRLGSVTGSFISGFFSALVVSPCVSAPLAGAVAGVAMTGNPWLGFLALFLLGLGLSTPLMLLGMTQGNVMPKAGEWMNWVKTGFALTMFAVALLLIERVWLSSGMLALWAVWFAVVASWLWAWAGQGRWLTRALAGLSMLWTACLMVGVALGSHDSWQPLQPLTALPEQAQTPLVQTGNRQVVRITNLAQLTPLLQQSPNVLVDVTANWCIECRINDKNLFANPPANLTNWQLVKLDVSDNTPDAKAVYQHLQVFGPPVLLYYQQGKLVARQNGEVKRVDFEATLNQLTQLSH